MKVTYWLAHLFREAHVFSWVWNPWFKPTAQTRTLVMFAPFNATGNLQDAWHDDEDAGWRSNTRKANKQNLSPDGHERRRPAVTEGVHRWRNEWPDNCSAAAVWTRRRKGRRLVKDTVSCWIFFFIFTLFACCLFSRFLPRFVALIWLTELCRVILMSSDGACPRARQCEIWANFVHWASDNASSSFTGIGLLSVLVWRTLLLFLYCLPLPSA